MSDAADPVLDELKSYGNELIPGGAEAMAAIHRSSIGGWTRPAIAKAIAERLELPGNARFKNREFVAPANQAPLRRVLLRNLPLLKDGLKTVDAMMAKYSVEFSTLDHAQLAGKVAEKLSQRESNPFLAVPIPEPSHVSRARGLLHDHFGAIGLNAIDQLAEERGRDLIHLADSEAIRHLAGILATRVNATRYGLAEPLSKDDPRLTQRPEPKPPATAAVKPDPAGPLNPTSSPPAAVPPRNAF